MRNQTIERKELPHPLDEFRTALEEEVGAASRNSSSSAIPLTDGKLIGKAAKSFQYAFKLENLLNTPEDSPGELALPGHSKVAATIVSIKGTRVVISVEENLDDFVPKAWLQTDLSFLMKKLIRRIEDKSGIKNFAANRMLGETPVSDALAPIAADCPEELNDGQLSAVSSSINRDLTVIWGPPGTGKTKTIGQIVLNLFSLKRSVLVVSHTNTAVDQAILKAASEKKMQEHLRAGAVVRVGQVSNKELKSSYPDVLLDVQKDRKSNGLLAEREKLTGKKSALETEVHQKRHSIELYKWAPSGRIALQNLFLAKTSIDQAEDEYTTLKAQNIVSTSQQAELKERHWLLTRLLELRKALETETQKLDSLQAEIKTLSLRIPSIKSSIHLFAERMATAQRIDPLRKERESFPEKAEQRSIISDLHQTLANKKLALNPIENSLNAQKLLLNQTRSSNALSRIFKGLPDPGKQEAKVNRLHQQFATLQSEVNSIKPAIQTHEHKLARIIELDSELSLYSLVARPWDELRRKEDAENELDSANKKLDLTKSTFKKAESNITDLYHQVQEFGGFPTNLNQSYQQVCKDLHDIKTLPDRLRELLQKLTSAEEKFSNLLLDFQNALNRFNQHIDNVDNKHDSHNAALEECQQKFSKIELIAQSTNVPFLEASIHQHETGIREISREVDQIDKKLSEVEKEVIQEASILGATLTKTYLSDAIQERTFDTVILDEASMAAIPSLWIAASLAEKNLILVGDFKQLPPICISPHKIAQKWLGRDIFEVSGVQKAYEDGNSPPHFIALKEQFRMRSEIADIANLFYDGLLKSDRAPKSDNNTKSFLSWFNSDWKFDKSPVCFIDTSDLNAWVTSIPKGDGASRLNFLSATLCVDIAEQLFAEGRPLPQEGELRILIVSPYQPHSKLIRLMIEQNTAICEEVGSGTAHSFQGAEADVVIFDLVVDEPHWKANLFTPIADEGNRRIYNVAMTRARQRLIIVGDFEWLSKGGKKVFLGKELLPFIKERYPIFSAKEVIPNGLAGKAARAQMAMLGGSIDANADRLVLNQSEFFPVLASDLVRAQHQVIIFSPFLTQNRVSFLLPQLQALVERSVPVFVITKCHSERNKKELQSIREIEDLLQEIGIYVMYKMRMHEKIVLIDDHITWSGSLNPLSFSDTQEIMERRLSKAVQSDYREILRVKDLIDVCGKQEAACPICSSVMVACEGNKEPFYWRCESDDCKYSRNIGSPYPADGIMNCKTCEGGLEFGEWGGKHHWRCTKNRQHRTKIYKSHLHLPKMVELIPKKHRRKVFRDFGLEYGSGLFIDSTEQLELIP